MITWQSQRSGELSGNTWVMFVCFGWTFLCVLWTHSIYTSHTGHHFKIAHPHSCYSTLWWRTKGPIFLWNQLKTSLKPLNNLAILLPKSLNLDAFNFYDSKVCFSYPVYRFYSLTEHQTVPGKHLQAQKTLLNHLYCKPCVLNHLGCDNQHFVCW